MFGACLYQHWSSSDIMFMSQGLRCPVCEKYYVFILSGCVLYVRSAVFILSGCVLYVRSAMSSFFLDVYCMSRGATSLHLFWLWEMLEEMESCLQTFTTMLHFSEQGCFVSSSADTVIVQWKVNLLIQSIMKTLLFWGEGEISDWTSIFVWSN